MVIPRCILIGSINWDLKIPRRIHIFLRTLREFMFPPTKLRELEAEFWELNIPDIQERLRLWILKLITYKAQAEGRAKDLSDFLSDKGFPWI